MNLFIILFLCLLSSLHPVTEYCIRAQYIQSCHFQWISCQLEFIDQSYLNTLCLWAVWKYVNLASPCDSWHRIIYYANKHCCFCLGQWPWQMHAPRPKPNCLGQHGKETWLTIYKIELDLDRPVSSLIMKLYASSYNEKLYYYINYYFGSKFTFALQRYCLLIALCKYYKNLDICSKARARI